MNHLQKLQSQVLLKHGLKTWKPQHPDKLPSRTLKKKKNHSRIWIKVKDGAAPVNYVSIPSFNYWIRGAPAS